MSVEDAAETIFVIAGPEVGRLLRDDLAWRRDKHAGWVADVLNRAGLPD
jgi:hypothetical protein